MPAIKASVLREKTSQELLDQLLLEKKRMFDGVVKGASGEAIKPHEKKQGRRLIARIHAILRERDLRRELDQSIEKLAPQAENASSRCARVLKEMDARLAEIKSELKKTEGRRDKTMPRRVRLKHLGAGEVSAADRAAVKLAEARRVRLALDRADMGEGK